MLLAERLVKTPFRQNDVEDRGEQRHILARLDRQMHIGVTRDFGNTWVDDNQLHPAAFGILQRSRRRKGRYAADRTIMRNDGVVADHQQHLGCAERVRPAAPMAHAHRGINLGRLIECDAGKIVAGADPLGKGVRSEHRSAVLKGISAAVNRNAVRAMLRNNFLQSSSNIIERCIRRHRG